MKIAVKEEIASKKAITWQEEFIMYDILDLLSLNNTLLKLPDMSCFTYCLKEMISLCNVAIKTNNKDYFKLVDSFFSFMKKDRIFKEVDSIQYITLLTKLKMISSNLATINFLEIKDYFDSILKIYRNKYTNKLKESLISLLDDNEVEYEYLDNLTKTFINELFSMGYTYKYLSQIFKDYQYNRADNNILSDFKSLIEFLFEPNTDNYDMYLPIKNIKERDINFIQSTYNEQKVELGKEIKLKFNDIDLDENQYYCHAYFSYNDYFKGLEENLKRIRSTFNVLKFYTCSQVDFDINSKTYIRSNRLKKINQKSIKSLLQFSPFQGTEDKINAIQKNFSLLKSNKNEMLEQIFDVMNYSQKDLDIFSVDQFVSKWISLETISGKSNTKSGFDAVLSYVPKFITISFFRQKLYNTLKKAFYFEKSISLEKFIRELYEGKADLIVSKVNNKYYKYIISNYCELLLNSEKIKNQIESDSKLIEIYLYRIYILRNKYVHLGDTANYNDIIRYSLNLIEPFFVDKIIKTTHDLMKYHNENLTWNDVFVELNNKYDTLSTALEIISNDIKISSNLIIRYSDLSKRKEHKNMIINILLERQNDMFTHTNNDILEQ